MQCICCLDIADWSSYSLAKCLFNNTFFLLTIWFLLVLYTYYPHYFTVCLKVRNFVFGWSYLCWHFIISLESGITGMLVHFLFSRCPIFKDDVFLLDDHHIWEVTEVPRKMCKIWLLLKNSLFTLYLLCSFELLGDLSTWSATLADCTDYKVWRWHGECYADSCMDGVTLFGGGSVMLCWGISITARTRLVTIEGHFNAVT